MGRAPCCDKAIVKRGPWSPEEDDTLKNYVHNHGNGGNWIALPRRAGLNRCGKSCRLRWLNYLRPGIKHGDYTEEEDDLICSLYGSIGSRWSVIASKLPGRTDNDIKNYWNTKLKKKLLSGPKTTPKCHIASHESTFQPSSVLPTSMPCQENPYYMNSAMCTDLDSFTWTSPQELNYKQSLDSQKVILDIIQEHALSPYVEVSDFDTSGRTNTCSTTSPYQDHVSTLSSPSSKNLVSNTPFWTTNSGVGEDEDISMQFCSEMFYDEALLANFCLEE